MATKTKTKKSGIAKREAKKKRLAAERKARREVNKGDGSFPDRLVVTKERGEKNAEGKSRSWLLGHSEDLATIYKDGTTVAVYKLVRVSTIIIKRKIALNRG